MERLEFQATNILVCSLKLNLNLSLSTNKSLTMQCTELLADDFIRNVFCRLILISPKYVFLIIAV